MSERILKALMQLFAIIARVEEDIEEGSTVADGGVRIVELFLKQQLNQELVDEYITLYQEFLEAHHSKSKRKDGSRKRTSVNSVKVLRICTQINEELTQKQKIIVLLRLIEFINANGAVRDQEEEFVVTVAETFNISDDEFKRTRAFVESKEEDVVDSPYQLVIDNKPESGLGETKYIFSDGLDQQIRIFRVTSVGIYLLRYFGVSDLYLNGQIMSNDRIYVLTNGSSIRSSRVQPIYYSDIISSFMSDKDATRLAFKVENIQYRFKGGKIGLHNINFAEESGKLIGIMGGSGAGKSTLLNVLNGNYKPSVGSVTINGLDIHNSDDEIEGVIGFISQDDLLIEELTVFQNLFYNAKLCFDRLSDPQIAKLVLRLLNSLGLYETKDLKVGSPLDKTISGGQRKRLNIALELIREPSVLFVDEPTSGLSSRDSENIMDLLKELALKGKLLFVVIHQPSSDIFKMFDRLMILDQGGYPIYYGNPVDAVIYFKKQINHANSDESECVTCGNVNPEQIFNIIESKVVDEYGNLTQNRKISPKEWNKYYLEQVASNAEEVKDEQEIPESTFRVPNKIKQFKVFMTRDILSKLTNRQYMIINLIEAPVLAAILSFFVKFYNADIANEAGYVFRENENIPQYLFMSVVVALFIGLTVSAEEIIRDQRILKRESFLNLSKSSYLLSKICIMFTISAIQSLLFILVGNLILEIKGMWLEYWLILFSASCFANMLGLNISASFNSAKVIYILIPFLIIPQLLFSGVIVKFDKLIPTFASQSSVPLIGNIMASRWAYEALAVTQFTDNEYEKNFYLFDQQMKSANWKKDYWLKELRKKVSAVKKGVTEEVTAQDLANDYTVLQTEIAKEKDIIPILKKELNRTYKGLKKELEGLNPNKTGDVPLIKKLEKQKADVGKQLGYIKKMKLDYAEQVKPDNNAQFVAVLEQDLDLLHEFYKIRYKAGEWMRENKYKEMTRDSSETAAALKQEEYKMLMNNYKNENLEEFVTNKNDFNIIVEHDGELIQKSNPIYLMPYNASLFSAHFYAPKKSVFGAYVDTFWANIIVLWLMSILLCVTLYFDVLKRGIEGLGKLGGLFKK